MPPVIWIYEALQAIILKSGSSGESVGKYSNLHPVRVWYNKIIPLIIKLPIILLRQDLHDSQDFLPFLPPAVGAYAPVGRKAKTQNPSSREFFWQ